jgi:hypothetical protein
VMLKTPIEKKLHGTKWQLHSLNAMIQLRTYALSISCVPLEHQRLKGNMHAVRTQSSKFPAQLKSQNHPQVRLPRSLPQQVGAVDRAHWYVRSKIRLVWNRRGMVSQLHFRSAMIQPYISVLTIFSARNAHPKYQDNMPADRTLALFPQLRDQAEEPGPLPRVQVQLLRSLLL